ncbi:MAG: sugar 3,4-ketoisomerase [Verrucomicrobiales bacterium]
MIPRLPQGVAIIELREIFDPRGDLIVGEAGREIPFVPRRVFFIHRVPTEQSRGEHAHRACHQLLICVQGQVTVMVDDRTISAEVRLDRPTLGLYVAPGIWAAQHHYTADAMLMVLASHDYDEGDYVRNYAEWRRL